MSWLYSEPGESAQEKPEQKGDPTSDVRPSTYCCCSPYYVSQTFPIQAVNEEPTSSVSQQDLSDVASTGGEEGGKEGGGEGGEEGGGEGGGADEETTEDPMGGGADEETTEDPMD